MHLQKIGIIGGTRGLGACFADFFARKFKGTKEILVSGRSSALTAKDLVEKCDLVIFSVPIEITEWVIRENLEFSRKNQIWADFTSIKQNPVRVMLESKAEVCGLHPVFGPLPEISGETIFACPARISEKNLLELRSVFEDFHWEVSSAEEHDNLMGIVQCVSHFSDLAMGETLRKSGIPFGKILKAASPPYQLKLEVMGRMFAQNPQLYAGIAIENPTGKNFTKLYLDQTEKLQNLIQCHDQKALEQEFEKITEFLGEPFCQKSWEDSQHFLSVYRKKHEESLVRNSEKALENSEKSEKVDLAVFGEAYSHTDEASFDFFPERNALKIRYFPNIFEIFEAVESGEAKWGIVPYENSREGSIFETLDELFEMQQVRIQALVERKISQCLMGIFDANPQKISFIFSHPQALAQSKAFLRKNYPMAKFSAETSTAAAARKVWEIQNPEYAAIGSKNLAVSLGLQIFEKDISGTENRTRFVLIGADKSHKNNKFTSFVFWFGKDQSGNLARVLTLFSKNKINLIKLDSRRAEQEYGNYLFFVDAEVSEQKLKKLFPLLKPITGGIRILGGF